jgi:hypothetical protein
MIEIIDIDKNILVLNELSVGEYLYLSEMNKNGSINIVDVRVIGNIDLFSLQDRGFLKLMPDRIVVREKAKELFVNPIDNFYRFVGIFPIKTPKGRYLSPKSLEGVAINNLKRKWLNLFKGNKSKEDRVISVLEAEIAWRKKGGELEYMTAIEAWLNGAFWEKYEHLLEDKVNVQKANNRELM